MTTGLYFLGIYTRSVTIIFKFAYRFDQFLKYFNSSISSICSDRQVSCAPLNAI